MRLRISNFGARMVVAWIAVWWCPARLTAQMCYVDPFTGQRFCTERALGRQPATGIFDAAPGVPVFNPQSATPIPKSAPFCRITVGDGSVGSGTLVARTASAGLVLTCSHLFDASTSGITLAFPNGERFAARLVERDRAHDLAALVIPRPDVDPVAVTEEGGLPVGDSPLSACGFGPNGEFRCVNGGAVGLATVVGAKHPSLTLRGAVRPGDSGGGVLGAEGKLVGVVWGQRDGLTYAMCGRPLREMLDRIFGGAGGTGGTPAPRQIAAAENGASGTPRAPAGEDFRWTNEIEARIRSLEAKKQDSGDYVRRDELPDMSAFARLDELDGGLQHVAQRFEAVLGSVQAVRERVEEVASAGGGPFRGLSAGKLLVGALGLSGPWAVAAFAARGIWSVRKRRRAPAGEAVSGGRAARIVVDSPPPPQRVVPENRYVSYEVDSFAKAHQWASEQVVRKYPGAAEMLQAQESLIKQCLAGSE